MTLTRRQLMNRTALAGAGAATLTTTGLLGATSAAADPTDGGGHHGGQTHPLFPPLTSKPGDLLALPEGFSYALVAEAGVSDLHDGSGKVIGKTPERLDGTGVVAVGRRLRLLQNHECTVGVPLAVPLVPGTVYDPGALAGGVTVIETTRGGRRISEWVGLSGTLRNCAGGITPWGSWLTCEETEDRAGTRTLERDHGYIFEVFPGAPQDQTPLPIKAWGRAPFEAAIVSPGRRRAYLTEDASVPNGLLYRWTAPEGYRLDRHIAKSLADDAGRLQAMVVLTGDGSVLPDLAYVTAAQIGRPFQVRWKDVPDRTAMTTSMRKQFVDGEITRSKKLEGAWGDRRGFYFVASFAFGPNDLPADATKHDGQLWYYRYDTATLTLRAYYPYNELLHSDTVDPDSGLGPSLDLAFDGPDNVHVSPYGPVIMAEDGDTAQHLLSWSAELGTQAIARNLAVFEVNAAGKNVHSEMTGPVFSPRGEVLFANVHRPGFCFAITGPWSTYL